jgi:hypothetical protein
MYLIDTSLRICECVHTHTTHSLLVEGNNEVTIHKFNHMINWFGPFCVPEHAKRILDEIKDILDRPYVIIHLCL